MSWVRGAVMAAAIIAGVTPAISSASARPMHDGPPPMGMGPPPGPVGMGPPPGPGGPDWWWRNHGQGPGGYGRGGYGAGLVVAPFVEDYGQPYAGDEYYERGPIGRGEAVAIARSYGLVRVDDVERHGGRYKVEGWDRRGDDIDVTIDRETGEVLNIED